MKLRLLGIGVDIVHKPRIARFLYASRFLEKICGLEERAWLPHTLDGLAKAWAAKEATAKTLGTGFWQSGVEWTDISLRPNWDVSFIGKAQQLAGHSRVELSFEEDGDYVIATAIRWSTSGLD